MARPAGRRPVLRRSSPVRSSRPGRRPKDGAPSIGLHKPA